MDRRKAMRTAVGVFAGGGLGIFTLANAFRPEKQETKEPYKLAYSNPESGWDYLKLDPSVTASLAYDFYSEGSCMYATVRSIISQLAEKIGEPFNSFPVNMFKYGHGGIGGYGSVCGSLNGAAAMIGLFIHDKSIQNSIISDIFQWYEIESFPNFSPSNPNYDYTPPKSIAHSVLCHASNTSWCKTSGMKVSSKERKERCRRLTADVAHRVSSALNDIFDDNYVANLHNNETNNSCMACHGEEGKLSNTSVKMSCTSCHAESIGHKVFADAHYKFME